MIAYYTEKTILIFNLFIYKTKCVILIKYNKYIMSFLKNLNWRYAVKEFNSSKKINKVQLNQILEAVRLSPSSMGLQPFHIYIVSKKDTKKKIYQKSSDQKQIITSDYLMVFCHYVDKKSIKQNVASYAALTQKINKIPPEKIKKLITSRQKSIDKKSQLEFEFWSSKQCYIALGFALAACAELKVASCPMEGFKKEEMAKVLKLPKYLKPSVLLAIGSGQAQPKYKKIRFAKKDLFTKK